MALNSSLSQPLMDAAVVGKPVDMDPSSDNPDMLKSYRICSETISEAPRLETDSPIFNISHGTSSLPQELRAANAKDGDIEDIVSKCNHGESWSPASVNPVGGLVPPGCIRLAEYSGRVYACGSGRWILKQRLKLAGYSKWAQEKPFNISSQNLLQYGGTLTICRVAPNEVGLAFENAVEAVLLGPGLHVYNTPTFKFVKTVKVQEHYFEHGVFHVLRVTRGTFALVWESPTQPRILRAGSYAIKSAQFKFDKFVNVEETYIKHGCIHIVQVPKGHVAKVTESVTPKLLGEGVHMIDHPNFHFHGLEALSSSLIKHGTVTRFRVNQGEIGLATWHNEAIFVEVPGTYEMDSSDFIYHKAQSVSSKLLQNGNKKVVTVYSGEVGLSYRAGCLEILEPGRHTICAADHYFDSFVSTRQVTLRLQDSTGGSKKGGDLLVAETKDFVQVGICADIFYSIADADKTIQRVGKDGVERLVTETAIGTLTNIIRSTELGEIAQSKSGADVASVQQSAKEVQSAQAMGQPSAPLFFDRAHDEFLARLHDDFLQRYGIEINNIRIESFKIMDSELNASLSKQALVSAQTQNQLANLKGQTEIATAEQDRQARVAQISAEQEARALLVATQSQNRAQLEKAESQAKAQAFIVNQQAEALISKARAEAEAIRLKSEAEAEAIRTKARAEAERAELLSKTPLGSQLALLELWAGTVERSNAGISKVVYCDPALQMAAGGGNPLGLLGMNNLQGEINKLTSIGKGEGGACNDKK